jgi:hypothetical protein
MSHIWTRFARSFQVNEIQRVFRGHLGRLYVREKRREKWEAKELSFFTYLCIQLQKCFRGYYSRKYKHDQARRKQYCRMLIEQGELVRQNLQKYAEELAEVRGWRVVRLVSHVEHACNNHSAKKVRWRKRRKRSSTSWPRICITSLVPQGYRASTSRCLIATRYAARIRIVWFRIIWSSCRECCAQ